MISAQLGVGVQHLRHVPPFVCGERFYEEVAVVVVLLARQRFPVIERRRFLQRTFDVAVFEDERAEASCIDARGRRGKHLGKFSFEFGPGRLEVNDRPRIDLTFQFLVVEQQAAEAGAVPVILREDVVLAVRAAADDLAGVVGEREESFAGENLHRGGVLAFEFPQQMYLRFHLAQQCFDRAELGDAIVAVLVLEQAGELHTTEGVGPAALQQHLARTKRNRPHGFRDGGQGDRVHRREVFPVRACGG